jgi:hypothetical protein
MLSSPFTVAPPIGLDSTNWDHLTEKQNPQHDKGFITQLEDPRYAFLLEKLRVEIDRLITLSDIRVILDEAPYVEGVCNKFINWTKGKPRFTFTGNSSKRAERVVNDMLERTQYLARRGDYLYNGLFLECFLKKQISFEEGVEDALTSSAARLGAEFMSGMPLGRVEDLLGPLPAETIFRNSDKQDKFRDPKKAFYQVPEPFNNPNVPLPMQSFKEFFHVMQIIHPRWNHRRQKSHRYSRPSLKPIRKAYNRTELSATDAVVQRHLAASRLLVIYLKKAVETGEAPGCSQDDIDVFTNNFISHYPTGFNKPGTVYITSGEHEVKSIGDMNLTLSKPSDIFMHFEFMSIGLMLSPLLAGFMGGEGGRVTGPLLEQLRNNLAMDIETVNGWEDMEILLPLCYFELFLNGIFDTKIVIVHDKPSFLQDIERKIMLSEVQMGSLSRESYHNINVAEKTGKTWAQEKEEIIEENAEMGPPMPTAVNASTGMKGSKVDSAIAPVKPQQ